MKKILLAIVLLTSLSCEQKTNNIETIQCDVLVISGSTSGVAAGIQAARMGANTVIVEETPWLGGMLTAAGVGATDGNHHLPSGIWGEFRDLLYAHYGGAKAIATGWVSMTQFEPSVGDMLLKQMADKEKNLKRIHGYYLTEVIKEKNTVTGAIFKSTRGDLTLKVSAKVSIDGTELGDAIGLSGADYRLGQDSRATTGERWAPEEGTDAVQDLTYVAILKKYDQDMSIPKPDGYTEGNFACMCDTACVGLRPVPDCDKMLTYGKLPNEKYMINWPIAGNDYYANVVEMDRNQRQAVYNKAKAKTLWWIYYLQTTLGYNHLGIFNEFSTDDGLAIIPYHREGRRLVGLNFITVDDLLDPYSNPNKPYYQSAIAVGDYPLDHHHDENPNAAKEEFPAIPSFSIPYGALVPEKTDGLLAAEKNISVSHLANGSTRLQPCVMVTGQAAGAAAALAAANNVQPREVNISQLQSYLLQANCWLMPFIDTKPGDLYFEALQKMGVMGILKGTGVPYKWANQTWVYPEKPISKDEYVSALKVLGKNISNTSDSTVTLRTMFHDLGLKNNALQDYEKSDWWKSWQQHTKVDSDSPLSRGDFAYLIDNIIDPFAKRGM